MTDYQKKHKLKKYRACGICINCYVTDFEAQEGECRINPPRGARDDDSGGHSRRFFPPVTFTDWCGKFGVIDDKEKIIKVGKSMVEFVNNSEDKINFAIENLEDEGEWKEAIEIYESIFKKEPSLKLAQRIFNVYLKFDKDNKNKIIESLKNMLSFICNTEDKVEITQKYLSDIIKNDAFESEKDVEIYEYIFEEEVHSVFLAEVIYRAYEKIGKKKGIKVEENKNLFEWAEKGAELGWAEGCFSASLFLVKGIVCEENIEKANDYLKKSAALGFERAKKRVEEGKFWKEQEH